MGRRTGGYEGAYVAGYAAAQASGQYGAGYGAPRIIVVARGGRRRRLRPARLAGGLIGVPFRIVGALAGRAAGSALASSSDDRDRVSVAQAPAQMPAPMPESQGAYVQNQFPASQGVYVQDQGHLTHPVSSSAPPAYSEETQTLDHGEGEELEIEVPDGAPPGTEMGVQISTGEVFSVVVPPGCKAGTILGVLYDPKRQTVTLID